jgi:hypothetical protein
VTRSSVNSTTLTASSIGGWWPAGPLSQGRELGPGDLGSTVMQLAKVAKPQSVSAMTLSAECGA